MNLPLHHTGQGFRNPHNTDSDRGFSDFLRWQFGRGPAEKPTIPLGKLARKATKSVSPDLKRLANPDSVQTQITWIGHATFLIQVAGTNILTDPIFSRRCSPVSFAGPERLVPPGVALDQLPEIHAVLISHNHYDHLDEATVKRLGNEPRFFVPLGLTEWFRARGITNVIELDWWQSAGLGQVNFHSVPVQHFSGRSLFDRNKTLWTGWVIETDDSRILFAGDTGYSPDFKEIGQRFGPMQAAMIPIGAYKPRWFMAPVHVDPPEAIKIHQDVQSEKSIAMHWGTFDLADEAMAEPPVYLEQSLRKANVGQEEFFVMKVGETRTF